MPPRCAKTQCSTPLTAPGLLGLGVVLLLLGLAFGRAVLNPIPAAQAQSQIDLLKGKPGQGVRSDDLPAGRTGWTFGVGAGADTDSLRPPTFSQKTSISASFSAGFGYSCGQFDPFDTVEQMIQAAIQKFKQLPQQFVNAAQAAVAGLPAYILNKINPSLYNVVTKNIDDAFKLFEINFKDCQQIEREIALGMNPYQNLVQAGIGDRMRVEMGFGSGTIDERMQEVRTQGPSNGVVMSEGKRYGGEGQPPIETTRNVLTAGINLLTDRSAGATSPFGAANQDKHPITQVYASPEELVEFVTDIYGYQTYSLTKKVPSQSKPGYGYQKKYVELRDKTIDLLQQYVKNDIERVDFERQTGGFYIPPETIKEMQGLSAYSLSIAIDDQARMHAVEQLKRKLDYAVQSLRTGLKESNVAQSEAYEVIARETINLVIEIQDDLAHLNNAVYLR